MKQKKAFKRLGTHLFTFQETGDLVRIPQGSEGREIDILKSDLFKRIMLALKYGDIGHCMTEDNGGLLRNVVFRLENEDCDSDYQLIMIREAMCANDVIFHWQAQTLFSWISQYLSGNLIQPEPRKLEGQLTIFDVMNDE